MTINNDDTFLITEAVARYFRDGYLDNTTEIPFEIIYEWKQKSIFTRYFATTSAAESVNEEILVVNKINNVAMVKARITFRNFVFVDYIKLFKINNHWAIKKKVLSFS